MAKRLQSKFTNFNLKVVLRSARSPGRKIKGEQVTGILAFYSFYGKLNNWNFHQLEIVSVSRDTQLQVNENDIGLTNWRLIIF